MTEQQFRAMYKTDPETGCEIWTGDQIHGGANPETSVYGSVTWEGKTEFAHKVKYSLDYGIPLDSIQWPEVLVLHECDNGLCGKKEHLKLGTQADNIRDCVRRGRRPPREITRKLCPHTAMAIHLALLAGLTGMAIAKKYGVSNTHVSNIKHGRVWGHVTGRKRKK